MGPTSQERIDVLEKVIGEPILKVGPDNPGGYLTKGEYQAKLDHEDEVLRYINEGDGRFGDMSKEEILEEIAGVKQRKDSIMMAFRQDHPTANFQKKDFRTRKEWEDAEIKAQADETLNKQLEGTGVTKEGFVDPFNISGIDQTLKSDFTKATIPKKLSLNIRLMKNFDQPLDDAGLAKEGYNLQEINVLKNARNRMTTGDELHPNEALLREKELLADEAGVDLDELKLDIDWGDMTPEPMATGGRVKLGGGSRGHSAQMLAQDLAQDEYGKDFYDLSDSLQDKLYNRALHEIDEQGMAQGGGVGSMFRRV